MIRRTSQMRAACPIGRALDAVGDWWTLLIVREAFEGVSRFGEFQRSLGLAKNILSARLRTLTQHGILKTAPASDGSVYQQYVLTQKGRALLPVLVALEKWGESFMFAPGERKAMLRQKCPRPN
ncbi:MAG TPA: helix-turn-helix domain-containing protein [Terrimicrobium sp.]